MPGGREHSAKLGTFCVLWHPAKTIPTTTKTPLYRTTFKSPHNYSKICGKKPRYNELFLAVSTNNLPRYNEYFVLSLSVGKNDMKIQMADEPNRTRIGQDRETLTFKALLYLNVAIHAQVCRLF